MYVAKHGDDANGGLDPDNPKLTISGAQSQINDDFTPSESDPWVIHVIDSGVYAEGVSLGGWVSLYGPAATVLLSGGATLDLFEGTFINLHKMIGTGSSQAQCIQVFASAADSAYIRLNEIELDDATSPQVAILHGGSPTTDVQIGTVVGVSGTQFAVGAGTLKGFVGSIDTVTYPGGSFTGTNDIFRADSTGIITDHGALSGNGDDDHTQYSLADGTRAFTGDVEIEKDTPQLAIENTTDSDGLFSRSGVLRFLGNTAASVQHTLGTIFAWHPNTDSDQDGDIGFAFNDGNDGSNPSQILMLSNMHRGAARLDMAISGVRSLSTSATDILWATESRKDGTYFTHSTSTDTEEFTFDVNGEVEVVWQMSVEDSTVGNVRSYVSSYLQIDTGGGFAKEAGSEADTYVRRITGYSGMNTMYGRWVGAVSAGDVGKITAIVNNLGSGATIRVASGRASMTARYLTELGI